MPIGAGLVAEGVAPERAGHDQHDRRLSEARLPSAGRHQNAPQVARAQPAESVVLRGVVVDARRQIRQIGANEVQLQVVVAAGCARGAKLNDALCQRPHVATVQQAIR